MQAASARLADLVPGNVDVRFIALGTPRSVSEGRLLKPGQPAAIGPSLDQGFHLVRHRVSGSVEADVMAAAVGGERLLTTVSSLLVRRLPLGTQVIQEGATDPLDRGLQEGGQETVATQALSVDLPVRADGGLRLLDCHPSECRREDQED